MKIHFASRERGQSIVLITLLLLAFIAILALVLDGGLAYASRRKAQNAADAGAMAGASEMCRSGNVTASENTAITYAVTNNDASTATAAANSSDRTVTVNATVTYSTTFAALLGNPTGNAVAEAKAGCFAVCSAKSVLPVAWSCKPPTGNSDSSDCAIHYGDPNGTPGSQPLYIIMDSNDLCSGDIMCQSEGGMLDCDLDDDGTDDTFLDCQSNSARSWLDLDGGGGGASDIVTWINGGLSSLIYIHSWLPAATGNMDTAYTAAKTRVNDIVTIPVFDRAPCPVNNNQAISSICSSDWHFSNPTDTQPYYENATFFHIASLAAFRITCVHGSQNDPDVCPAFNTLAANLATGDRNKLKSIEGYFVEGYNSEMRRCDAGSDPADAGAYTVNLIPVP